VYNTGPSIPPTANIQRLSVNRPIGIHFTNFFYLHGILGRAPKIGELLSFATRALFLRGLTKPIDEYRIVAILLSGNIGAKDIIRDLMSRLGSNVTPIFLLGPTAPMELPLPDEATIGWVTTVSGVSSLDHPILSPENPTSINVFLNKAFASVSEGNKAVVIGDFLDNIIPQMSQATFHKYYSDLVSGGRMMKRTFVFIVKADIHPEVETQVVKRFADVFIENREREEKGRLLKEVRVTNLVEGINTNWRKY
jgi:hypothetical protein